jgi:hypothetical protein
MMVPTKIRAKVSFLRIFSKLFKTKKLAFARQRPDGVQNCTDSRPHVITFCQNENECTHVQATILRAMSYLWCRYQEELCAEFRGSTLKTSHRSEVCRH